MLNVKRFFLLCAVIAMGSIVGSRAVAAPVELFVGPSGNDAADGTIARPFATIGRALAAVRAIPTQERSMGGATIFLLGGRYNLAGSITLGPRESGTAAAPTVIEAYRGEPVTLSGGSAIGNWRPYKDGMYQATLPSGIKCDPVAYGSELYYDDCRCELARWPKSTGPFPGGEYAFTAGVPQPGTKTQFYYDGDAPSRWAHPELAQAYIFAKYDWLDDRVRVASIDTSRKLITLSAPTSYPIEAGRRFYIRNVFEELGSPGQWYFDTRSRVLTFYPPVSGRTPNRAEISVLLSVFTLDHAHDVVLSGLTIENVTGSAIDAKASSGIRVEDCEILNTGRSAVRIADCYDWEIRDNQIHDTGGEGVKIASGDRQTLTPCRIQVVDNHIFRFGRLVKCYAAGVTLSGVGVTVSHNLIHDGPHNAILMSGNDNVISFNDIHHVCLESCDCGAIYTGRDWTFRGNVIRSNKIHDIPGFGYKGYDSRAKQVVYTTPNDAEAIYLDDGASSFDIVGNAIYRVGHLGVELGGGRDTRIVGNVFVDTNGGIGEDARLTGWYAYGLAVLRERLNAMPFRTPPWSTRYPELAAPMRHDDWPEGNEISANVLAESRPVSGAMVLYETPTDAAVIDHNTYWNAGAPVAIKARLLGRDAKPALTAWDDWIKSPFDHHGQAADPLFADPAHDDYRLRPASPALASGFEPIPWDEIGLLPGFPAKWRPLHGDPGDSHVAPAEYRRPLALAAK